jgi:hypothetical protein
VTVSETNAKNSIVIGKAGSYVVRYGGYFFVGPQIKMALQPSAFTMALLINNTKSYGEKVLTISLDDNSYITGDASYILDLKEGDIVQLVVSWSEKEKAYMRLLADSRIETYRAAYLIVSTAAK